MESFDGYLSEVHINLAGSKKINAEYYQTRFVFINTYKKLLTRDDEIKARNALEDDDLDPPRKNDFEDVLIIRHSLTTTLNEVGNQVWLASLLMADYVLYQCERFKNRNVIELGVGVGLDAVILSKFASRLLCTDFSKKSLELTEINIKSNKSSLKLQLEHLDNESEEDNCSYLPLDWTEPLQSNTRGWSFRDRNLLESIDFILASDVIYSEDLTNNLFKTIIDLVDSNKQDHVCILISLEKRLNFTIEDADITCPAYNHFIEILQDICTMPQLYSKLFKFSVNKIEDIPKYFVYTKSPYMEFFEILATQIHSEN